MDIYICIGSACHLKGSYEVVENLNMLIEKYPKKNIVLKSSFCLGKCSEGVSVKFNEKFFSITPNNVTDFFNNIVLKEA